jgi:hypothetical protein
MAIDIRRMAAAAVEAALANEDNPGTAPDEKQGQDADANGHRLGGVGAVAVGIMIAAAAHAAYTRARNLDLERIAEAVEERLAG